MKISIDIPPLRAEEADRDVDYELKHNYSLHCELESDAEWVDIDDEVQMFVTALKVQGYHPASIRKGFENYLQLGED